MPKTVDIKPEAGVTYIFRGGVKLTSAKLGLSKLTAVVQASGTYVEPPPADPAPTITDGPNVANITATSATIRWTVSEVATGQVEYGTTDGPWGTTDGPLSTTPPETSFSYTTHVQGLTNLPAGKDIRYRVFGKDTAGQVYGSAWKLFRTLTIQTPPPVDPAPVGKYPPDTTLRAVPVNNDPMPGG